MFDAKNRDLSNKRIDETQIGHTRAERERPDSRPSNKAQAFYMNCELQSRRLNSRRLTQRSFEEM